MVNRSLVTEEQLNPLAVTREVTVPIIYGVVGTQVDTPHTVNVPRLTKTNDVSYGEIVATRSATIPIILACLNIYGIADVVVVPVASGSEADGWPILAQDGRATHLVGDDSDWELSSGSPTTAKSTLVTAKAAAAESLQGIVAINIPLIGDASAHIDNVKLYAQSNANPRVLGVYAGGTVVPTFRPSGNWTMPGAAPLVMGAIATNPFYQHPEFLQVNGIASVQRKLKFAPRDATSDSEILKFANVMSVINTRGGYYTWGKSLMQALPGDQKKYVEVRNVSDHFERFIDGSYLNNIRAIDRTDLYRLMCDDIDTEIQRLVDLRAIRTGNCSIDPNVQGNQVGFILSFSKEHPFDSVKVTKVINIV